ncbi:MAG: RNA methyltransferase [Actinobacteria bacterium RBG_16_64_13]|nr:MAG: RNA methyltransferase [Actinobacteria bacterium RBG_16_64_13]
MAYDEGLAQRVREVLAEQPSVIEKSMFGGICFLLRGNMVAGVVNEDLMVRVGPEAHDDLVSRPDARPMDFTGKSLKGFVYVGPEGLDSDTELRRWIGYGVAYAGSLPGK